MERSADTLRFCHCRDGPMRWPLLPDDRHCSGCGRALIAIEPRGLRLGLETRSGVACYLRPSTTNRSALVGKIMLATTDSGELPILASWVLLSGFPARTLRPIRTRPGEIEIELEFPAREPSTGQLAHGIVAIDIGGEAFRVPVSVYGVDRFGGMPRMVKAPGQIPKGAGLIIYRGEPSVTTYLEFETNPPLPILWKGIDCLHDAVSIELMNPEIAATSLRAKVVWESALLDASAQVQHVPFRLRFVDLPSQNYSQQVRWRNRSPLTFRPSVLIVPWLVEGRVEPFRVEFANDDRDAIQIRGVTADVPWITTSGPAASGELSLKSGDNTTFDLTFDACQIAKIGPPVSAKAEVRMANRGAQSIEVRVQAIRPIRVLDSPLLIDPGPPRIVVAYQDATTGKIVFPTASGDTGIAPESLGISRDDYARAIRGVGDVRAVVGKLLVRVIAQMLEKESWKAQSYRVVHQPWVPNNLNFRGVTFQPWWQVTAIKMTADLNVLIRIGAWSVETAERFESSVRLLDLPREGARPSIGSFLNEWLAARVRPRLRSVEPGTAPWLILAAEGLMADYRRGPEHAWKRLARKWRRAVPEARHIEINIAEADEALAEHAAGILRQTAEALWAIASNRNQHASIILMGPFLNGERRATLIDSIRQFIDVDLDSDDLPWIEQIAD